MKIKNKLKRLIERPARLPISIQLRYAHFFNDQTALVRGRYWMAMGKHLNLRNPFTFTEKIQWLKLHDHNPLYHILVDKCEAKEYVANMLGQKYIIPTIGIWDSFDRIDFDALPNEFVLKTTSGGGSTGVVLCRDKLMFDKEQAKKRLESSAQNDIYKNSGEWVYKDLKPRYIAEQFMSECSNSQNANKDLSDYKFYCFGGEPKYCQVIRDRNTVETIDFYDMDWNLMPFVGLNPSASNGKIPVEKPGSLDEMISIAKVLSANIPFVRIDLYLINKKIYFGEITFYPSSGFGKFKPAEWDAILGSLVKLPQK